MEMNGVKALLAAVLVLAACAQDVPRGTDIEDCFESTSLASSIWDDKRARDRYWLEGRAASRALRAQAESRREAQVPPSQSVELPPVGGPRDGDGDRVLALRSFPWDVRVDEDGRNVVKHEIWLQEAHWVPHAQTQWYGFSVRVDFREPDRDGTRFVVAQWKEEASPKLQAGLSGGPFVALRVDSGKLIVTLQQDSCRVPLAAPDGWKRRLQAGLGYDVEHREFQRYLEGAPTCSTAIRVTDAHGRTGLTPLLPDVGDGDPVVGLQQDAHWADVAIKIRSRAAAEGGEVELWVAGREVARATGPIGNTDAGPMSYFKFGVYRDYDANECLVRGRDDLAHQVAEQCRSVDVRLDNFRRGTRRAQVDPAAGRKEGRNRCAARSGSFTP